MMYESLNAQGKKRYKKGNDKEKSIEKSKISGDAFGVAFESWQIMAYVVFIASGEEAKNSMHSTWCGQ